MRVVLCQAFNRTVEKESDFDPLGLAYLSSYVAAHVPDVEVAYAEGVDEAVSLAPDFVGISSVSQNIDIAKGLARGLRERGFEGPLVLGGVHISELPAGLSRDFDAGIIGEGEQTLLELIRLTGERTGDWREHLGRVAGLCFHADGGPARTPARKPIEPLDLVPHPDRELCAKRWPPLRAAEIGLITSRGCPHQCGFCSSSHFWKNVRFFSAEYVLEEISDLAGRYRPDRLVIHDDLFAANTKRLKAISDGVKASGLADELEFVCNISADSVNPETCRLLGRMNVRWVVIGIESASDRVLKLMNKRASFEQGVSALRLLCDSGITAEANMILGYPGETVEDMENTVSFIEENLGVLFRDFLVFPLVPFPGTLVWLEAVRSGLIPEEPDPESMKYSNYSFNPDKYVYLNPSAPREQFLYYLYYLRFIQFRERMKRSSELMREAGRHQAALLTQIDDMGREMEKASRHIERVEAELGSRTMRVAELEAACREAAERITASQKVLRRLHALKRRVISRAEKRL